MHGDSDDQEMSGESTPSTIAENLPILPKLKKTPDSFYRPDSGYAGGRKQIPPKTECTFAAGQILPLLDAFFGEIDGVKEGSDEEHLHRMRVATRRIRAALHNFRYCFSEKRYRKFNADTRNVTRALGQARDADVQIAFLRKARKKLLRAWKDNPDKGKEPAVQARMDALQYLITKLRRERDLCQKNVLQALEKFGKQNQPDAIRNGVLIFSPASRQGQRGSHNFSTLTFLSAEKIGQGIIQLLAYEPWLQHPEAVIEHHAMRIAAKHLRYTLEIFAPVYRLGLKKYIARVTRLQQLLGELHDTDVWIDMVSLILIKERSLPRDFTDPHRPGPVVINGLKYFLKDREKERAKLFGQTVRYWSLLRRTGVWEDLKKEIFTSQKAKYTTHREVSEEMRKDLFYRYSQIYPEGAAHSLHVVHLSLQLFDELQTVHQLGREERRLLEYGAVLHDIGWKWGKEGHAKRSGLMIQSTEQLPLTMEERGIIGLLAVTHRGKGRFEQSGYFGLLLQEQQEIIRLLAGILRVADALDGLHRSRVRSLRCEVADDKVICTLSASSECSEEVSIAKKKAEVLEQAIGKPLQFFQDIAGQPVPEIPIPGTVSLRHEQV
jgi:CHAD domain-containing protein